MLSGSTTLYSFCKAAGAGVLTLFKALEAEERFALHGGGEQLLLILVRLPAVHEEPGVLAVYPGRQAAVSCTMP